MKKKVILISLLVIAFLFGSFSGLFVGYFLWRPWYNRMMDKGKSRKEIYAAFADRVCRGLKLDEEQKSQIEPLVENWINEIESKRAIHKKDYKISTNKFFREIVPLLTEDQKNILRKWRKRHNDKNKQSSILPEKA